MQEQCNHGFIMSWSPQCPKNTLIKVDHLHRLSQNLNDIWSLLNPYFNHMPLDILVHNGNDHQ
jgi:hypothetical protein